MEQTLVSLYSRWWSRQSGTSGEVLNQMSLATRPAFTESPHQRLGVPSEKFSHTGGQWVTLRGMHCSNGLRIQHMLVLDHGPFILIGRTYYYHPNYTSIPETLGVVMDCLLNLIGVWLS